MWDQELFAARLRFMIRTRDSTQKKLAKILRVNPATISRWMRSRANYPGLDQLEVAAKHLKVDVCWLAFGCAAHQPKEWVEFIEELNKPLWRIPIRG